MKILKITAKCNDCCQVRFGDIATMGYVPRNIGIGGGDYIKLEIDAETGQILNWKPLTEDSFE